MGTTVQASPHLTHCAFSSLLGRNGHDGAGVASPDPLLLAPDPMSGFTAYKTIHNLGGYAVRGQD